MKFAEQLERFSRDQDGQRERIHRWTRGMLDSMEARLKDELSRLNLDYEATSTKQLVVHL